MVSVLDSGVSGQGSSLGQGHCVGQDTLSTQVYMYKWVPATANCNAGDNPAMD